MLSGGETVLVGLSGGPDSVCLLTVLKELGKEWDLRLHALYADHGLRPDETPAEIAFCKTFCEGLAISFDARSIDVKAHAKEQGMNRQEAARELRYRLMHDMMAEIGGDRIALGHNADDQVETFLMRILRGAGPKGLSGMQPVRGKIIRPLLEVERKEIEEFLDERRITYIIDSSNLTEDYLRNRIRQIFMLDLKRINPGLIETMTRTMDILREEEKYFDTIVTKTLMKLICRKRDLRIELFLMPMERMERVILRRVLRRALDETTGLRGMEFIHIEEIIDLIKKGRHGDRLYLPKGLRIIKNYATLVMTSEAPVKTGTYALDAPGEIVLEEIRAVIKASVEEEAETYGDGKNLAVFDADKTGTSLEIRPRGKGDFFYPQGFGRRKKLQDFFVDEKVPRDERDEIPIVAAGEDIIWIAGMRGDERFGVSGDTKRYLKMEFKKAL